MERHNSPEKKGTVAKVYGRCASKGACKQNAMDRLVCQRLLKKLHIAGIFHTNLPEKGDTGGGATENRSLSTGYSCDPSWGEREIRYPISIPGERARKCRFEPEGDTRTEYSFSGQIVQRDSERVENVEPTGTHE